MLACERRLPENCLIQVLRVILVMTLRKLQDEFEQRVQAAAAKGVIQGEKRFKAEPVSPLEWER